MIDVSHVMRSLSENGFTCADMVTLSEDISKRMYSKLYGPHLIKVVFTKQHKNTMMSYMFGDQRREGKKVFFENGKASQSSILRFCSDINLYVSDADDKFITKTHVEFSI